MQAPSTYTKPLFFYITLGLFAAVFASITFVNHYCFRTYGYDLGINNNAIFDYAHFRWNDCMIMQPQFDNVLSDHFSLIPVLVSPLYWVFGTYTMLVVQWLGILLGGYGIYTYLNHKQPGSTMPVLAMAFFFSIWGIYSALGFDYHDNVMAAMFVPWFVYFFDKQQWGRAAIVFGFILITKENMAFWMVFMAPAWGLLYWRKPKIAAIGILFGIAALVYFAFIVGVAIPALSNADRAYLHFKYDALGHNFSEAITTVITRPVYTFKMLYTNPTGDAIYDNLKPLLFKMLLLSGGWALFFRPQYLIMVVPILAQKLFSNDPAKWGVEHQYSIEFVPILTLAVFDIISRIENNKLQNITGSALVILCFGATIHGMEHKSLPWHDENTKRFYSPAHYKQDAFNVDELHRALKIVPDDAKVSAQSYIAPHLCFRDYIYHYPHVADADYVVLGLNPVNTYPIANTEAMADTMQSYRTKPGWQVVYDANATLIAKRK